MDPSPPSSRPSRPARRRGDRRRVIVGHLERVDLPEWSIRGLVARIDSGARTSAIHVEEVSRTGRHRLRFKVMLSRDDPDHHRWVEAEVVRHAKVRSSTGHVQKRPVVRTLLRLGEVEREIEITLVSRGQMKRRMLLGRSALSRAFLVDPGRIYRVSRRPGRSGPR